ncbi:MAG: PAS domain S-box protein, partial [bacterium]|nr:PAS domain S-box protein [bacterium]
MKLRLKFLIYLAVLHLVFALCAVWFFSDNRVWLIAVEIFFVVSFGTGVYLLKRYFDPLRLIQSGAHYIRDGEFTSRFTPTGQQDVDGMLDVYNSMVDRLREERIRNEEQELLLNKVLEESPGGVITLDVDGRIATVNPAAEALMGIKKDDAIGRNLADLDNALADGLAQISQDSSKLIPISGRKRVRCRKGSFMDRGFPRQFLLLDELTDELHQTEKRAYEKLIRMMSHEVNNTSGAVQSLLQSSLGYAKQLRDDDREDFARALEVAIQRTANLDKFMSGFANVVRLPQPQLQPSNPWRIAQQTGLLFKDRCEAADITWKEELDPDLPDVSCDPVQLEQVLVNVIKNATEAIESTGKPGEITLTGSRKGRSCSLSISDTGPGLSPEVQKHLFTPFYTTRENGQGIGLTMVQEILLAHGFDFSLENKQGKG